MTNEDNAVKKIAETFEKAWNSRDAEIMGAGFADDGTFIDFLGHLVRGRNGFVQAHRQVLQTVMARSKFEFVDISVKTVQDQLAILLTEWKLAGEVDAHSNPVPDRHGRLTFIARATPEGYQVVHVQNTEIGS